MARKESRGAPAGRGRFPGPAGSPSAAPDDTATLGERKGPKRRALLVLGMHRSGTSALTKVLSLRGAMLPATLMKANEDNQAGYFESEVFYDLHNELLAEAGSSWDDVSVFPPEWFDSDAATVWEARLLEALVEEFGDSSLFVLKDPRMCRLLPLWYRVLERADVEPSCVLIVRNPIEVAKSLGVAQECRESQVLLLWLQHVLAAERFSRQSKRVVVSYDALLEDWRSVMTRIESEIGLAFPLECKSIEGEADEFLNRNLRHQTVLPGELAQHQGVTAWIQGTYRWMIEASEGKSRHTRRLDLIWNAFTRADDLYGSLLAATRQAASEAWGLHEKLEKKIRALEEGISWQNQEVVRLTAALTSARSELVVREEMKVALDETLAQRDREARSMAVELSRVNETLAQRDREAQSMTVELSRVNETLARRDADLQVRDRNLSEEKKRSRQFETQMLHIGSKAQRLERESAERDAEALALAQRVDELVASVVDRDMFIEELSRELESIERSVLRKATKPLRRVTRGLSMALKK